MKKSNKANENKEINFLSLPKVLKELIFVFVGEIKQIGRMRRICKIFRDTIDKSRIKELQEVEKQRKEYVERKEKESRVVIFKLFFIKRNPWV